MKYQKQYIARLASVVMFLLLGCGRSEGRDIAGHIDAAPVPLLLASAKKDLMAVAASAYTTPTGIAQECIGRLLFDSARGVEWPTAHNRNASHHFDMLHSQNVHAQGDQIEVGGTRIAVLGPVNAKMEEDLAERMPAYKLARQRDYVKEHTEEIEQLKKEKPSQKTEYSLISLEQVLEGRLEIIAQHEARFSDFVPGLPDSVGYSESYSNNGINVSFSVFWTRLKRGNYIYIFESTKALTQALSKEKHRQQFLDLLSRFRPRKLNEIPHEMGMCIPYGFIADDGKTSSNIQQSLRWPDAPGVLYSIHTGTVQERGIKIPMIEASGRAAIGLLGSPEEADVKPFVTTRITPRSQDIGALSAVQGGVALKIQQAGKPAMETYSVFTGYAGQMGIEALPYIHIDMSTRTMAQAPELKTNPPPFKQSMERLEVLLKSTRLRPTTPPMPDLANLPQP